MKKQKNIGLIVAILFATISITGSLVFLGLQLEKIVDIDSAVQDAVNQTLTDAQQSNQTISELNSDKVTKISRKDYVRGDKNATISLIEYSDFQCPYCAKFHTTGQQLVENYNGQVNWVYRHFPLPSHTYAFDAALAAECIGDLDSENSFWEFTDLIFTGIIATNRPGMIQAAKMFNIDNDKFTKCLDNKEFKTEVEEDFTSGQEMGVNSTPGIIVINNETGRALRVRGALPYENFEEIINELLK